MTNGDRLRNMNDDELANFFKLDLICYETEEDDCVSYINCLHCREAWVKKKEYKPNE